MCITFSMLEKKFVCWIWFPLGIDTHDCFMHHPVCNATPWKTTMTTCQGLFLIPMRNFWLFCHLETKSNLWKTRHDWIMHVKKRNFESCLGNKVTIFCFELPLADWWIYIVMGSPLFVMYTPTNILWFGCLKATTGGHLHYGQKPSSITAIPSETCGNI